MIRKWIFCASTGVFLSITQAAAAQPSLSPIDQRAGEMRFEAAVTIPLGSAPDSRRRSPRLELVSRSRLPDGVLQVVARDDETRWQERRLGITLDGTQTLMLNGNPVERQSAENNLNTVETVLVVGGVVLVAAAVVGYIALNNASD